MYTRQFAFNNGDTVKEKITGFTGVITGTAFYLTGCAQYCVVPPSKNNSEPTSVWFDEGRLELVSRSKFTESQIQSSEKGCDTKQPFGKRL